jgi:xanthine dehydrogenase accessory factor
VKDILDELDDWKARGEEIALATVVQVEGSAPRPSGARLALTRGGSMVGSVSGGCVESDVYERALRVLDTGQPALTDYGPAEPDSFEVGLSCDGHIEVLIEPFVEDEAWLSLRRAVELDRPAALAVGIGPERLLGKKMSLFVDSSGEVVRVGGIHPQIDDRIAERGSALLDGRSHGLLDLDVEGENCRVFIEAFVPAQRIYLVGATHIAVSLCRIAKEVGFRVSVIDPRTAFADSERFASAHEVLHEWPVDVLDGVDLGPDAYILTLTHDPKFDLPTLARALKSDVRYIGALGSRKTHERRLESLRAEGFDDQSLSRIRTPVGLDLGGRRPEEIALAIVAEMVAARYSHSGAPLSAENLLGKPHGN